MRPSLAAPLVLLVLLGSVSPATAQEKGTNYAFLVACSEYREGQFKKLPYAFQETEEFRKALLLTGFDDKNIVFLNDRRTEKAGRFLPLKDNILEELDLLTARLTEDDTLLVLFNGHGLHFKGDKNSYFCPTNVKLDKKETMVPLDGGGSVFALIQKCKAGRKLLLVNACRNDPDPLNQAAQKDKFDDETPEALPKGMAALFSCSPGQKCYYYPPSAKIERSLFMNHLIQAWQGTYAKGDHLTLEDVFKDVKSKAAADAAKHFGTKQIAFTDHKYTGEWNIDLANLKVLVAFQQGKNAFAEHHYDEAIEALSETIRLNSKFGPAYSYRAWSLEQRDKSEAALRDAQEGVRLQPESAFAWAIRGLAYRANKDFDKALKDCDQAVKLDPRMGLSYAIRCHVRMSSHLGESSLIMADVNKAIELDPNLAFAFYLRGQLNDVFDPARAIADFTKAIELDPKYKDAYHYRAMLYSLQMEYVKAAADCTKWIELDPKDAGAYRDRGKVYYAQKEYAKAIADYTKAIELDPKDSGAYYNRGMGYWGQQQYEKGIADFTKCIELDPAAKDAGDERPLLTPTYQRAYINRAALYLAVKDYPKAIADCTKAIDRGPGIFGNVENHRHAYTYRGYAYSALKDYDKAIADFTEAIRLDPKQLPAYQYRAFAYAARGKPGDKELAQKDRETAESLKKNM